MAKSEYPFDQFIKENLEEFPSQKFAAPDWNHMNQKIQEAEADLEFDTKIKASLKDLKLDAPQIQWEPFVSRTNQQIARRNKIIMARAIEVSLLLLLLWTIDNMGISHFLNPANTKANTLMADLSSAQQDKLNPTTNEMNTAAVGGLSDKSPQTKNTGFDRKKIIPSREFDATKLHKKLSKPGFLNPLYAKSTVFSTPKDSSFSTIFTIIEPNKPDLPISDENSFTSGQNKEALKEEDYHPSLLSPAVNILLQELTIPESILEFSDLPQFYSSAIKPAVHTKSTELNVHGGLMMNIIQSPSFDSLSSTVFTQLRSGLQAAVGLGFQTDRFLLESGLSYQYIHYEPNFSEILGKWTSGYYKLHFKNITAHILTIPVLIHADLFRAHNWSVSAKAGLSLSASLKNEFTLDTTITHKPIENQGISFDKNDENKSLISSKVKNPSNQGILNGGSFGVNSYTNLVVGMRFKQKLHSNISYYVEVELSKMLGELGFGPNNDRFISCNLNTGISFRLK